MTKISVGGNPLVFQKIWVSKKCGLESAGGNQGFLSKKFCSEEAVHFLT